MIKGIEGYHKASIAGDYIQLPKGKYICEIKQVECVNTVSGKAQLMLLFDIVDGEYKGYYTNKYESDKQNNSNAKYKGIIRQLMEGEKSLPFYKAMMIAIQRSNSNLEDIDFSKDWDGNLLKGCKMGVLFNLKEVEYNGKTIWITQPKKVVSLDKLETSNLPDDEPLESVTNNNLDSDSFYSIETGVYEDNLPF